MSGILGMAFSDAVLVSHVADWTEDAWQRLSLAADQDATGRRKENDAMSVVFKSRCVLNTAFTFSFNIILPDIFPMFARRVYMTYLARSELLSRIKKACCSLWPHEQRKKHSPKNSLTLFWGTMFR